ncbi:MULTISPECIES: type I polyketide synthase [Nostoc]|uniref:Acyltransferase domain-containing protein n=1 Tax=Nostoc punctiforme FACHB-252 TaxID=1357509 RepID=A0ABR8HK77_NOSPU|nr:MULTISPECIES: type I polyketide synthase [Nostoc]MBC1236342.1 acyltransferase domain-containing protein [Nostoc sp. 2RC]MBD2615681.1 acyltransferase domain-containing protein [Nostoc punctiforme FACHB-252]
MKNNLEASEIFNEIAIVGINGRFPKAKNLDEFWQNLQNGVESISVFSDIELESAGVDKSTLNNPNYVKANAELEDVELFDASFFNYSPRAAELIDPQQRLFLEVAWEALESAGYNSETYEGRISVYGGASVSSYFLFNIFSNPELIKLVGFDEIRHSNRPDNLATRVAYKLNLNGSAITVQTGCSTSLVAVHLACQSLLDRECDLALAGGVCIFGSEKAGYFYQEGGILSPDGHCRAFDAKAKGTVSGEGVGIVVLKRLEDAIADGDFIHAIIKASAINNDGSKKVGYTAPSVDGQAQVIAEALAVARVKSDMISYVEAHGTGTALGDPIEIAALTKSFRATTDKKGFCAIGSVKTNIGHLDTAAGIAGLIKTVLALKHQQIPPSLHFQQPNPQIDFINSPFYINNKLSEWKSNGQPRRAGVSSFGIGGTNAHVILEEAPILEPSSPGRSQNLLVISAKTSFALETATTNLVNHLKQHPQLNLADVAYTLGVGRQAFEHRRIVVCQDIDDAVKVLEIQEPQRVFSHFTEPSERQVIFMFPGQGAQYVEMGKELYQNEPIFRKQVDYCAELLKFSIGIDLRNILYPSKEQATAAVEQLTQTYITQPALFVIEYALAQLWMSWGLHPEAMIGHSIGEYVAACLAGVFSLEDALALVAARGKLMQQMPSGDMLVVPQSEKEVQSWLGEELSLAAINGPSLCVVSGSKLAIDQLHNKLTKQGINCRRLHTSGAFHSQMMNPIIEPFMVLVQKINLKVPQIPFISNVTGTWITAAEATDPSYWAKHLRQTVRFAEGITELLQQPKRILLEVGPGRTLSTLVRQHSEQPAQPIVFSSLRHPQEQQSDVAFLLNILGKLWLAGLKIDWSGFYATERRHRIPLPTYPFERQRYWVEPQSSNALVTTPQKALHKKPNIAEWFYIPVWKQSRLFESVENTELSKQKLCWLVFVDKCEVGSLFVKRLQQQGQDVITVSLGEQFTKLCECPTDRLRQRAYCINPQQKDDYEALFQVLRSQDLMPQMIAHLWGITPNNQTSSGIESLATSQAVGFYSLLFLSQALGQQSITDALQILVVTNNIHDVTGEENPCPEKATVLGPCKVIPQEYPNITCRNIDIVIPESVISQQEKLIDQLIAEFTTKPTDSVVAYRKHHRWIQTFEPVSLEEASPEKARLQQGGVYLITGGLGGIGLTLAEYLAKTVQAKLVLISRSGLPKADEWEKWLITHDEQDPVSKKIRAVQVLEGLGAEVLVERADVANLEQMQLAIASVTKRFGKIHGVIHAAGIAGGGIMQLKTPQVAASVLAPKVQGTLVLDSIFKDVELDFLILCSALSSGSILGRFGQVDYCAANAFLDAFAHCNTSTRTTFTQSINWGAWQEVGMAVNTAVVNEELKKEREEYLKEGIPPQEGVDAFSRILQSRLPQVVVSTRDIQAQIQQSNSFKFLEEELASTILPQVLHSRPNLGNDYIPARNKVEQIVTNIWQQILGIQQVGIHDNFFELGGNSLISVQIISKLKEELNIEIPIVSIYERPTINSLTEILSSDSNEINHFEQNKSRGEKRRQKKSQQQRH